MKVNWIELIKKYDEDGFNPEIHIGNKVIWLGDLKNVEFNGDGVSCIYNGKQIVIKEIDIKEVAI